ncbi:MAG: sodium-translocating pyrophosphatase [Clostridiales Family XIII bacterium]|jgi:K(+)-stimulated pyrophosphate-energized sodium pump|nr:sodium-translocating pyrophosphatase [Clostridiales Family XIII bacterium]
MEILTYLVPVVAVIALAVALFLGSWVKKQPEGSARMVEISGFIRGGAMAFLKREYRYMAVVIVVITLLLGFAIDWATAGLYVFGAIFSILAGFFGMKVATWGNVRTANAANEHGLPAALKIAFRSGAVMGICVSGLGLLGLGVIFVAGGIDSYEVVTGFSLGASSMALFGRVGGGIYTKAADVGADLVGKVEAGIPEDDPRNPAVIADNVGDNVGDVAGMGSDLFESYVGSIVSALALAAIIPNVVPIFGSAFELPPLEGMIFPLILAAVGLAASVVGVFFVRGKSGGNPATALNVGTYVSSAIVIIVSLVLSKLFFGNFNASIAIIAGLVVGVAIGKITEIYTSSDYKSVKHIAEQSLTGEATTIISGIGIGMLSTVWPIICIAVGIYVANGFAGVYGIALAAVGMLSTTAMVVAVDAYGPVADNAGGIAEMCELPAETRVITDKLDSVGNTTAAIGKGFAIASAALTALALFVTYAEIVGIEWADASLLNPMVVIGLFLGAMLPFLFGALTMNSVGKAAYQMIEEVRRQFKDDPGIMAGTSNPDYERCVDISTKASLKEMIVPGLLAIVAPLLVGFLLGSTALAGLLAGALSAGVLLAIMMANAGGAWDNAKKYVEEGNHGGKGSLAHKATVVGDTVGDPFKDTSGPSMNILIKLMTIVAVVFGPLFTATGLLG